ncbi:hypothetical protein EYF80_021054 [Liparis tanakae]|uniref:Uncharacterized protein n=1 Tax=Liparis tanakae TaxID=230148 RepID=A0A4Z2HUZ5_9TELE|nr:hypothetical protein EYF80_021054 [Liparis tanakae]
MRERKENADGGAKRSEEETRDMEGLAGGKRGLGAKLKSAVSFQCDGNIRGPEHGCNVHRRDEQKDTPHEVSGLLFGSS